MNWYGNTNIKVVGGSWVWGAMRQGMEEAEFYKFKTKFKTGKVFAVKGLSCLAERVCRYEYPESRMC